MDSSMYNIIGILGITHHPIISYWTLFQSWRIISQYWKVSLKSSWFGAMAAPLQRALIMDFHWGTARRKMAPLLKLKWMIYIQLWAPYCLTHKAICFCSCFQLITPTERAHSLSSDEVWWWRLMMSASSHHHLASSTLFYCCLLPLLFKSNCMSIWETFAAPCTQAWYNKWKCKTFVVVNMQISSLSLFTSCRYAIS